MHDSSIEGQDSTLGNESLMKVCNFFFSGVTSTMSLESGSMVGPVCKQILKKKIINCKIRLVKFLKIGF